MLIVLGTFSCILLMFVRRGFYTCSNCIGANESGHFYAHRQRRVRPCNRHYIRRNVCTTQWRYIKITKVYFSKRWKSFRDFFKSNFGRSAVVSFCEYSSCTRRLSRLSLADNIRLRFAWRIDWQRYQTFTSDEEREKRSNNNKNVKPVRIIDCCL